MTSPYSPLPPRRRPWSARPLLQCLAIGSAANLVDLPAAQAQSTVTFQSGFLHQDANQPSDAASHALTALGTGQSLAEGEYRVDLSVNGTPSSPRTLYFASNEQGVLGPCLSAQLLATLGVRLSSVGDPLLLEMPCIDLGKLIPGARFDFDAARLHLAISIPQIAVSREALGYIDPEQWDYGINAAFVNYQLSAQQGSSRYGASNSSEDLYLNGGINLGAWRLRSSQSLRRNEDGQREWLRAYTYVQRDLPGTHANLTLGETFTGSEIMRSVPIKGVVIGSDLGMLPDSQQGYAPIIRGVAQSRSKLEVLRDGYPIYSTYVSAGPYVIDDLSTAGGSGELEVVLTEADGQVRRFIQPYASLGNLLREGSWRYSAAAGRYNAAAELDQPLLWQGTLAMGIGWNSTLYGGLMASDYYRASTLGAARDLGEIGALALDVTWARSDLDTATHDSVSGSSYALKYGKTFQTDTNLRFAGYRYSTEGYRDFDEAVRQRSHDSRFLASRRSRLEASVHQRLFDNLSLSLTYSHQDYWQSPTLHRQFQLNASTHHRGVSYNLFASQSLTERRDNDRQIGLSISMPLEFGSRTARATFDVHHDRQGYSQRASLSGNADSQQLSYQTSLSRDTRQQQTAAVSLGYQTPVGNFASGYTQGNGYRNLSVNASGALLLHAGGLELGPYLGDTSALIEVPDISGVGITNAAGAKTNARGYALLPYLQPYRSNLVQLETDQLGPEVEIDNGAQQVIPRRGAVVKTTFPARKVNRLVLTTRTASGQALPFGAQVVDAQGHVLGVIGQGGQVMLSTTGTPHTLSVRWGDQQCQLPIDPAAMDEDQGYRLQTVTCL
ncbi:fimbria/pilus outer membrane usher protein [Pseudomonas sp. R5(2019)]|uniref:fimbria/pilus outer membrane usher protein n=1 Tax=Pseudomonas sp. R5(2019) TaxID=2697566 RepID=UPI00141269A0|nr:fimbria/pilus outer membrane usher protein [Pseudomonas sp. R5(2019)]NBA97395.1 fimbria/pilus outer membrane usher protein [Pseudomonas sp. R5(2019)]